MSNFKLYTVEDTHPDDVPILEAAQVFLNLSGALRTTLPISGSLRCFDDSKQRVSEVVFHWVDGDREVVVSVGAVPSMFHRLMQGTPKISGLFSNYLTKARELGISTPKLIALLEDLNISMLGLGYPPAEVEEGHGFTEIPIALYTFPEHTLAYVSVAEMQLGKLGTPEVIYHH